MIYRIFVYLCEVSDMYMHLLLRGGRLAGRERADILVKDGLIAAVSPEIPAPEGAEIIDIPGMTVMPAFADVHVHFRVPGRPDKETVRTGSLAAARGGYGVVCTMPNLDPVPDSPGNLAVQQAIIDREAVIRVLPYAAITEGRKGLKVVDMDALKDGCVAFSDDGSGVQRDDVMLEAMTRAKAAGRIIAAHCEVDSLLGGGYIHDGEYCRTHGHKGICPESEWGQIARDIELCRRTGCSYHVCHISAKESVDLIRKAKAEGLDISCETGPHYLVLCDSDLQEDGRFKMNPPLRGAGDREALIGGLLDGTIDMIATDHAPHTAEEKSRGLASSALGVVGLETAFPVLYTELVRKGVISLEKLVELMSASPRKRFSLGGGLEVGQSADITVFDLGAAYRVDSSEFLSKGRATPFEGREVYGKCMLTLYRGSVVWRG